MTDIQDSTAARRADGESFDDFPDLEVTLQNIILDRIGIILLSILSDSSASFRRAFLNRPFCKSSCKRAVLGTK
jgi:hypothetical protein